jgi:hypothetical protein
MGLFGDTLHDARRPLAGAWVRRSPDDAEAMPDELPDTGMQTVFRFQKGESSAMKPLGSHEASPGPVAGSPVMPAADPLSVGAEVGTPEPLAKNVNGNEGISVFLEVSRTSELATGQAIHRSPGKMAAANAKSGSGAHQSEVSSGRLETEPYREPHKSNIPEGSERLVSENGETSGSRPSGRGASPSETHADLATLTRAAAHPAAIEGEREIVRTEAHVPAGQPTMSPSLPSPTRGGGEMPEAVSDTSRLAHAGVATPILTTPTTTPPSPTRGTSPQDAGRNAVAVPNAERDGPQAHRGLGRGTSQPAISIGDREASPRPRAPEPAPPSLVIGRIDVVVVADAPAKSQPAARPDTGYLSRNYLKRL